MRDMKTADAEDDAAVASLLASFISLSSCLEAAEMAAAEAAAVGSPLHSSMVVGGVESSGVAEVIDCTDGRFAIVKRGGVVDGC